MIVTITHAEIVAAIQGSGSITKSGVTLTFNNCYVDNDKCYMKAEYTPGDDNTVSRYFTNYGSVDIKSSGGNIISINGFYGKDDKNFKINNGIYEGYVKDITFYPSNSWIYGIKYNNILHKFRFPESLNFDTNGIATHSVNSYAKNDKYLYTNNAIKREIRPIDGNTFEFNDGTTINVLKAIFRYFIEVSAIEYDPGIIKGIGQVKDIYGEASIEDFKKYVQVYDKLDTVISNYDVVHIPIVERTFDKDSGTNGIIINQSYIGRELGSGNIIITIEDSLDITQGIVDSLDGATFDSVNNRYERVVTPQSGQYFDKLTIYTYVEDKTVNVLTQGVENTTNYTAVTTPTTKKLLKSVTSVVDFETKNVDVVASGVKGSNDYTLTTNHSTGKLLKSVVSKVNFETRTINAISGATLSGSMYVKTTTPSVNRLINTVVTHVPVEDKTITETNIINKDTITPTSGTLINSIVIPELYDSYNVDYNDIERTPHLIKTSKKLVYPLTIDLYKTIDKSFGVDDLINKFTQIPTLNNNVIIPNVNINIKSATCSVYESDITSAPHSIFPPKDTVFNKVDINAALRKIKLSDIEVRNITFVEPRIPTIYYGIYVQLLKKFGDNANKLLDDCECNCKHNNYNQKLISCWNLFHYACALYMEDSDSKMAQNIIKLIVSQLNLMYKEDEDFLISKYYIGKYKNETSDEYEFNYVSIFDLTPVEIDVCSEKEFNIELNHDTSVHYIMLPPDVELRKVWYNNSGIIQILFDKEAGINEYNSKLYKLTDFGNDSGVVYWYYCSTPINNIQIECGKKK
jgi:hypothetical protein